METGDLSRSCVPFRVSTEEDALRYFLSNEIRSTDDLVQLAAIFGTKDQKTYEKLQTITANNHSLEYVSNIFAAELSRFLTLTDITKVLFLHGNGLLAKKLFWCYYDLKPGKRTVAVSKIRVRDRDDVTSYFIKIKSMVHARVFKNPYEHVKKLGQEIQVKLNSDLANNERRLLCDKLVVLKAIEYDAGSNVSKMATEDDDAFLDMERVLEQTSVPSISKVLMYGRKADAMSTLRRFDEGENMLTEAYVCADVTYSCLEIIDMIYKGVVFKLSHFEQNPSDDIQKEVLFDAHRALTLLSQEREEDQHFWKILLKIRMVFALLGVGKQCRVIRNYFTTTTQLDEARTLLSTIDFNQIDHRKQMFYLTALARIHEFRRQRSWCIYYLEKAMILAIMGNYSEKKFINDYGELVGKDLTYLIDCVLEDLPPVHINPVIDSMQCRGRDLNFTRFTESLPVEGPFIRYEDVLDTDSLESDERDRVLDTEALESDDRDPVSEVTSSLDTSTSESNSNVVDFPSLSSLTLSS